MDQFLVEASRSGRTRLWLTILIFFMGACGTFLAALGTYIEGAFHSFVAFTTCLVNALTRYLDYLRVEWAQTQYSKSYKALTNVHSAFKSVQRMFLCIAKADPEDRTSAAGGRFGEGVLR